MADSATVGILRTLLTMDTSSYDAGAKKAAAGAEFVKRHVEGLKQEVQKLSPLSERMVKSLGGDKLLYTANSMTAAVQKLGGAHKLTDAEQTKVNRTLDAALQKYKLLGQEAPRAMVDLERATRRAEAPTNTLKASVVALGAAAGMMAAQLAGTALRAVINLGREAIETAGKLVDLSQQTGLSTTTLQRMDAVAGQTGTTIDVLANAAFKLSNRISGGGDSVRAAVQALGLDFEALRKQKPDQQFESTIVALGKMQNATVRNDAAVELFGIRLAKTALGAARDYEAIANAAQISSEAQLQALDVIGDRLDKAEKDFKATTRGMLADALFVADEVNKLSLGEFLLQGAISLNPQNFARLLAERGKARATVAAQQKAATEEVKEETQVQKDYVKALAEARGELSKLDAAERRQIQAAKELGTSQEDLVEMLIRFGVTSKNAEAALALYSDSTKVATKGTNALERASNQAAEAAQRLSDHFFGEDLKQRALEAVSVIGNVSNVTIMTADAQRELANVLMQAVVAWDANGQAIPRNVLALLSAIRATKTMREELEALQAVPLGNQTLPPAPFIDTELQMLDHIGKQFAQMDKAASDWRQHMNFIGERLMEDEAAQMEERKRRWQEFHEFVQGIFAPLVGGVGEAIGDLFFGESQQDPRKKRGILSAEEYTRSLREFESRWERFLGRIGKAFKDMLGNLLSMFVNEFLKGMVRALAGTALGQAVGNWIAKGLGIAGGVFGGGAPGGLLGAGGTVAAGALGIGGAAALPGAAAAPTVAALLGAPPVAAAAAGGSAAAGGGAAAGGAAAGAGGGAAAGLMAALPWAGIALGSYGLIKSKGFAGNIASGALTGASIGTLILPGVGTAVGAAIGAAAGAIKATFHKVFGGPDDMDRIREARKLTQQGVPVSKLPDWIRNDESTMKRIREGRLFDTFGGFAFGGKFGWGDFAGMRPPDPLPAISPVGLSMTQQASSERANTLGHSQPVVINNYISTIDAKGVRDFVRSRDFTTSISRAVEDNTNGMTSRWTRALRR
jgi:hypothetical protein